MSKLALLLLLLASPKLLFAAFESETCTQSKDCEGDGSCCYEGVCTTDRFICLLDQQRKIACCLYPTTCEEYDCSDEEEHTTCYADSECLNGGCCVDSKCFPKSNWQCSKSCTGNWECDSGCCKDNKCQATKDKCDLSCHYYTGDVVCGYVDCCVDGQCQSCGQTTADPWLPVGTTDPWMPTTSGYTYDNDDFPDEGYEGSESSSGGLSTGASIGIALASIIAVVLKLSLWGCCYAQRRQRVIVVRRRVACVRVAIVEHDHLQQEHERAEREIPARLPPPYSPRPLEDDRSNPPEGPPPVYTPIPTTNPNETTESAQTQMAPPPANPPNYSPNADQNANSAENSQTQGTGMAGNAEQANDVPQVPSALPPPSNPANPSTHTSQNATEQNAQENTIGPFLT